MLYHIASNKVFHIFLHKDSGGLAILPEWLTFTHINIYTSQSRVSVTTAFSSMFSNPVSFLSQLIQLLGAVDPDEPAEGHHFYFSMVPEKHINPNFTIRDNQGYICSDNKAHTLYSL